MRTRNGNRFRPHTARTWSIRAKIISLLLVPLVALIAMWALATAVTLGSGLELFDAQRAAEHIGRPTQSLVRELQAERKVSLIYLAGGNRDQAPMLAQRARTDAARQTLVTRAEAEGRAAASEVTLARLDELLRQLDSLALIRASIDRGEGDRTAAFGRYTQVLGAGFLVTGSLVGTEDADLAPESHAVSAFGRAREVLAQEDAVISAALTAGTISTADLLQSVQLVGTQRYLFAEALPDLGPADRAEYQAVTGSEAFTDLVALENRLVAEGRPGARLPVDPRAWFDAYTAVATQLQDLEARAGDRLADRSAPAAWVVVGQILVAGLLGLITVTVTIVASVRIGRSLLKRLAGLRQAALELAVDRLPRVVTRLRRGEEVDVDHDAPPAAVRRRRDRPGRARVQRAAAHGGQLGGRGGHPAPRSQRGLPQHRPSQPDAAAPATVHPGQDGAPGRRPDRARGPVPGRPPRDPHAPPRRGPGHPGRGRARPRLAQPGAGGRRAARRGLRGRGLLPGQHPAHARRWRSPAARSATSSTCWPS